MLDNLLFYRLIIFNFLGLCALAWAYHIGWIAKLIEHDISGFVYVIFAVFSLGLVSTFRRGYKVSKTLNEVKAAKYVGPILLLAISKFPSRNFHLYRLSEWIATLGLIGNALGFFIALDNAAGGDATSFRDQLIAGMGVAFGATLAGSVAGLWTWVNFAMIDTTTASLIEDAKSKQYHA